MSEERPKKRVTKKKPDEQLQPEKKSVSSKSEKAEVEKTEIGKTGIDPFAQMFQIYDTFARSWSNVMSEAVASKSFAESMGKQMESSLDAMTLMRRQMGDFMEQYLQHISLPTRKEVISNAKRLTHLEMAMDDLDAKMDEVLDLLKAEKK